MTAVTIAIARQALIEARHAEPRTGTMLVRLVAALVGDYPALDAYRRALMEDDR